VDRRVVKDWLGSAGLEQGRGQGKGRGRRRGVGRGNWGEPRKAGVRELETRS